MSATIHAPPEVDTDRLGRDLPRAAAIEAALSRFVATSDVVRFDAAPLDAWILVSDDCIRVLATGLEIGRQSGGAFDVGLVAEVAAHGFGAGWAATGISVRRQRRPAHDVLDVDAAGRRVRKRAALALDLAGIARLRCRRTRPSSPAPASPPISSASMASCAPARASRVGGPGRSASRRRRSVAAMSPAASI